MANFEELCENTLMDLCEKLENFDKETKFDIDYSDGILNIIHEDSQETFVINRHSASGKIWYSSPKSGADYFSYDESSKKWLDDKNQELEEKLFLEVKLY